jgi:hypothetical protein
MTPSPRQQRFFGAREEVSRIEARRFRNKRAKISRGTLAEIAVT